MIFIERVSLRFCAVGGIAECRFFSKCVHVWVSGRGAAVSVGAKNSKWVSSVDAGDIGEGEYIV